MFKAKHCIDKRKVVPERRGGVNNNVPCLIRFVYTYGNRKLTAPTEWKQKVWVTSFSTIYFVEMDMSNGRGVFTVRCKI
jgi:hypothetical protein